MYRFSKKNSQNRCLKFSNRVYPGTSPGVFSSSRKLSRNHSRKPLQLQPRIFSSKDEIPGEIPGEFLEKLYWKILNTDFGNFFGKSLHRIFPKIRSTPLLNPPTLVR